VTTNEAQHQRWNDDYWTATWPRRERQTTEVTPHLLEALAPAEGERILDVGPGGGLATLAVAERVGRGEVVGVDISRTLTDLATRRARERGVTNATFTLADAQVDAVPGAPFDAVVSQFGVMFFDDPRAAFANIRAQVVAGGRLVFVCWRAPDLNPWFIGPALAAFLPAPPAPPGEFVPGPFAFADPVATARMLVAAGWARVECRPLDLVATSERDAVVEDDYLRFLGVAEDDLAAARAAVDATLRPYERSDGRLDVPLAVHVVRALNQG